MRMRGGTLVAALVALAGTSAAYGQVGMPGAGPGSYGAAPPEATTPERLSVAQRPHPDYTPLGVRAGSFLVFPSAGLAESYDSNVFATQTGVKSDFVTDVTPDVTVDSDWNNHALDFDAGGDIKRYASEVSENVTDAHAIANGRLDVRREIYFLGGLSYQREHEDRSSPNSIAGQKNPTEYQVAGAGLSYVHEPGRLGLRVDGTVNSYFYDNGQTATGASVVETDRNRTEYIIRPRLAYEIVPGYHAFVQLQANRRDYQSQFDQFGIAHDSHGYEADAGTALSLGGIINGEIYAGYLKQFYDTDTRATAGNPTPIANKPSVSGVGFGGNLLWNVTDLTSLRFAMSRAIQETIVTNAVGATTAIAEADLVTAASVSVEHELLRNVLLTGGVSYTQDAFQGITRTDNSYGGTAGANYLINRYLSAGLNLSYTKRSSNQPGNDYDREIVMASLRTQF
jgi:hypothetical protein